MFDWLWNSRNSTIVESESSMRALREYKKLSQQKFTDVQKRLGLNGATSYAHLYFSRHDSMKRFNKELELQSLEYNLENNKYEIMVVVPDAQIGKENQNNKMVDQITKLSLGCGFLEVSRVDLKGISALEGARQLAHILKSRQKRKKVILVSFSHSSASVRIMLDQMNSFEWSLIQGWVNISGLIFGSPFYFCSNKKSIFQPRNFEAMRSYSSEQKYFLRDMKNYPFKTVHFLGLKLSSQMNIAEHRRYQYLKAWGPNDGLLAFSSYQRLKSPVVTALGEGHLIDLMSVTQTFSRSLCALVSLVPKNARVDQWTGTVQKETSVASSSENINL